jgi:hypothetical protein
VTTNDAFLPCLAARSMECEVECSEPFAEKGLARRNNQSRTAMYPLCDQINSRHPISIRRSELVLLSHSISKNLRKYFSCKLKHGLNRYFQNSNSPVLKTDMFLPREKTRNSVICAFGDYLSEPGIVRRLYDYRGTLMFYFSDCDEKHQ